MRNNQNFANPLGSDRINTLILRYSLPSVVGMLVNSLYNIIDQIFIGHGVGLLGTATTNIAFPITTICTAISMLIGIGGATNLNLYLGKGDKRKASNITGNAISMMLISGILLSSIFIFCLDPILRMFGATDQLMEYSRLYTQIIVLGIPFLIISSAGSQIIRADGSPTYSMISMIIGAVLNTVLDPIFIFIFKMGIAGAAWATVISQIASCTLVIMYLYKMKSVSIQKNDFKIKICYFKEIALLGAGASINQLCITFFQIVMNNSLSYYGARSVYGSEIPLACVGVITKINTLLIALISGTSQGCQPIFSFNFGAKKFDRLLETLKKAMLIIIFISTLAEVLFQFFPRQIVGIFGAGDELYFAFAERYLRIFMLMTFVNGVQILVGNFLSAMGKAFKGIIAIIAKQLVFMLPSILILPIFWGIDGIVYAGPIADSATALTMLLLLKSEIKKIKESERILQC